MEKDFSGKIRNTIWNSREDFLTWPVIYPNTTACPKCHTEIFPQSNRPDIVCLERGIEVKEADERFDFSSISEGQRAWATSRVEEGFVYFICLQIGVDRVDSKSEKRRRAYLIPWMSWLEIENKLQEAESKSIPLIANNHHGKLKDLGYDCVTLLKEYELVWNKGWIIPHNHVWYTSISQTIRKFSKIEIIELEDKNHQLNCYNQDILVKKATGKLSCLIDMLERGLI